MNFAVCLECDRRIILRGMSVGDKVVCAYCDSEFELVSLDPPELDWAYEDGGSDWDDDEGSDGDDDWDTDNDDWNDDESWDDDDE